MTSRIAQLTYAIGDVHGYDDLFERMIDRLRIDAELLGERPRLVLLGDYIDRGPSSPEVIARVARLLQATWCDVVALKGNHEAALLRFLDEPDYGETWRTWGGAATATAYGVVMPFMASDFAIWQDVAQALKRAIPPDHLAMLAGLPTSFRADDYLFVHAGVDPDVPLAEQDGDTFMSIRGRFLRADKACDYVVVHGHTPEKAPVDRSWRIGVDTGIYFTGVLTAVRLHGDQRAFLQVKGPVSPAPSEPAGKRRA